MKVVYIRSRRGAFAKDGNPALKSHPNGDIQANTFGQALEWENWKLDILPDGRIALQSWIGKFLSAKPDGSVRADSDSIGDWEKWTIVPRGDGNIFVALRSHHGKYLCCDDLFDCGKTVRADRHEVQEWEEWMIVDDPHAFTNPGHTARCAIGGTLTALGAIATLGALAIPLAGFGVEGVVAGSAAAAAQSAFYGASTGGLFSVLQSVGATLAWVPVGAAGAGATATGAAILQGND